MTNSTDKKLILLVDDAPMNIHAAREILKDLYSIRVATSGAMALEAVKIAPAPDLILLDIMMPGMNGYEVCTRLKADISTRDIPVIFLTAMTQPEQESRGFAVGGFDFIHKPFSAPVLLARVRTHLMLREDREQLIDTVLDTFVPPVVPAKAFDAKAATALVTRLQGLLAARDGNASEVVKQVTDALTGGADAKLLAALRSSVEGFDFDGALAKLDEITRECNLRLESAVRMAPGNTHQTG